jgi:hypothetical protein
MTFSQTILFVLALCALAAYFWRQRQDNIEKRRNRNWYAGRCEPIFELARDPKDGAIEERCEMHRAELEAVNNLWFKQGHIAVIPIHYSRDGHFSEDFYTEYPVRAAKFIEKYINTHHKDIKELDEDAYKGGILNQKGFNWEQPN